MPGNDQHPSGAETLRRRHEAGNLPAGWLTASAGMVLVMLAACLLASWIILAAWVKSRPLDTGIRLRGTIVAGGIEPLRRFPKPNLEISPSADLTAVRGHEDEELTSYGWIDRKAGIVRIPIDRAMDLIAQRGLPVRASNAPAATGPSEYDLSKARSQSTKP